jgi:hypothetical protein
MTSRCSSVISKFVEDKIVTASRIRRFAADDQFPSGEKPVRRRRPQADVESLTAPPKNSRLARRSRDQPLQSEFYKSAKARFSRSAEILAPGSPVPVTSTNAFISGEFRTRRTVAADGLSRNRIFAGNAT